MKDIEKIVYLSHAYGGLEENKNHVEKIIESLIQKYPNYTFISPIHCFGYLYDKLSYDDGMRHCLALLDMCDEMWTVLGKDKSKGVLIELAYCKQYKIPVKSIKICNERCEYNNKVVCGVDFCMVPKCIKE